ncbi:UNVERIFIED_CONTAM: hypothetical protein NCL1_14430 [Trichonephila clavipes]
MDTTSTSIPVGNHFVSNLRATTMSCVWIPREPPTIRENFITTNMKKRYRDKELVRLQILIVKLFNGQSTDKKSLLFSKRFCGYGFCGHSVFSPPKFVVGLDSKLS